MFNWVKSSGGEVLFWRGVHRSAVKEGGASSPYPGGRVKVDATRLYFRDFLKKLEFAFGWIETSARKLVT